MASGLVAVTSRRLAFTAAASATGLAFWCHHKHPEQLAAFSPSLATGLETVSGSLSALVSDTAFSPSLAATKGAYSKGSAVTKYMSLAEFREIASEEDRIVVSFMGGVYDVTDFTGHPGGYGRLQMVAGWDLEPFWKVYTQHNRGHIIQFLQRYRIGTLSPDDAEVQRASTPAFDHPYQNAPPPYPELLTNTSYPYNAEGKLRDLTDSFITPIGKHYVRNHAIVPDLDPETYTLTVKGEGLKETVFTLNDLKTKFPKVEVTSVIQCNGNRREDHHYVREGEPGFGPPHWVAGAIGNSTWSGVRLRDVLREAGMDVDNISLNKTQPPPGAEFFGFEGYDHDEVGNQYCCSIPFEKGIDPHGDVILAYEMNGQDIPRSHGYPVRAIVPGSAGARNCKYLETVHVTHDPCAGSGNWKQYAVHSPDVPMYKLAEFDKYHKELKKDPVVQDMPVQSLITVPGAGDVLTVGGTKDKPTVAVKGFAWGGGGSGINRVDVSLDGGKNFTRAELLEQPIKQRRGSNWAWHFFEKEMPLPPSLAEKIKRGEKVQLTLTSRALNTSWNSQPETVEASYNPHGCCVNHWYKVPVVVDPKIKHTKRAPVGDFENKPSGGKFKRPFKHHEPPPKIFGAVWQEIEAADMEQVNMVSPDMTPPELGRADSEMLYTKQSSGEEGIPSGDAHQVSSTGSEDVARKSKWWKVW